MKTFTKASLTSELIAIRAKGWIATKRKGNDGGVGNTLEDLLGIKENNLPLPNAGEWELKGQRANTQSLITLFHMEPSPRAMKFVPKILLPQYGWPHAGAGKHTPAGEMSFRMTIQVNKRSDRGFAIVVNRTIGRVEVSFDRACVDANHHEWLKNVEARAGGLGEINPQPYWGFGDLFHKAGTKLPKTVYAIAESKKENSTEFFRFTRFYFLENFNQERFIEAIGRGDILVDFDARTGHNHGTKFRLRQGAYSALYDKVSEL